MPSATGSTRAWGLSAEEVARVILFCGVTVGLGLVTLARALFLSSAGGCRAALPIFHDRRFFC